MLTIWKSSQNLCDAYEGWLVLRMLTNSTSYIAYEAVLKQICSRLCILFFVDIFWWLWISESSLSACFISNFSMSDCFVSNLKKALRKHMKCWSKHLEMCFKSQSNLQLNFLPVQGVCVYPHLWGLWINIDFVGVILVKKIILHWLSLTALLIGYLSTSVLWHLNSNWLVNLDSYRAVDL